MPTKKLVKGDKVKYINKEETLIPYGIIGTITEIDPYSTNFCSVAVKFDGWREWVVLENELEIIPKSKKVTRKRKGKT